MGDNSEKSFYNHDFVERILQPGGNLYAVLNLTTSASSEDVDKSYIHLVNVINIDGRFTDSEPIALRKALQVLEKAYKTLHDPDKRKDYDFVREVIPGNDYQPKPQSNKSVPTAAGNILVDDHVVQNRRYLELLVDYAWKFVTEYYSFIFVVLIIMFMVLILRQNTDSEDDCDYYYNILGVSRNSTISDIKKAYKQLARKLHPDKKASKKDTDVKKFSEIVDAYKVLSNLEKRKEYDLECEYGILNRSSKTDSPENATAEGFRKYGLYSMRFASGWCANMFHNVWLKLPTQKRVEGNTETHIKKSNTIFYFVVFIYICTCAFVYWL